MIKRLFIFAVVLGTVCACSKESSEKKILGQLKENIRNSIYANDSLSIFLSEVLDSLPDDPFNGDQVVREVFQHKSVAPKTILEIIGKQQPDGSWKDINYADTSLSNWEPVIHANRLLLMVKAYENRESELFKNRQLKNAVRNGIDFYHKCSPVCKNWWYNEIGIPRIMGLVYLLFEKELSPKEKEDAVRIVLDKSVFKMTGQNKVWLAGNVYYKALLMNDLVVAKQARDTIVSEINTDGLEGIKPDYSFHQHGPMLQMGNYGLAFITGMANWCRLFNNTPLAFKNEHLETIRQLMLDGYQWVFYKGKLDINVFGRQFSKNIQQIKTFAIGYALIDLMEADSAGRKEYLHFFNSGVKSTGKLIAGHKHFWYSDYTAHHTHRWMATTHMSSFRVKGTEAGNGDNLKGYYLADGATFIYVTGNEYKNSFPFWNWHFIPGTTTPVYPDNIPLLTWNGYYNQSDFSGGVTDGREGVSATILNRDGLTAHKAWFYTQRKMVCLGSGIRSTEFPACQTTINQCLKQGSVVIAANKKIANNDVGGYPGLSNIKWVYHNNIGYYFNGWAAVDVKSEVQSGSWNDIMAQYPPDEEKDSVFTLNIIHTPKNNSYAVTILPAFSEKETRNFSASVDYEIIENSTRCQAVYFGKDSALMAVFYEPYSLKVSKQLSVLVKQPCLLMIGMDSGQFQISDPTQKQGKYELVINNEIYSGNFPQNKSKGSTLNLSLRGRS